MKNLFDIVKDVVSGDTLDLVTDLVGSDKSSVVSAMGKFAPAIIGSLIGKGNTVSGAQGLIDLFKQKNYGESNLTDLVGILGNKDRSTSFLNTGAGMLDMLLGRNSNSVIDKLISMTGLGKGAGGTLLKLLAPIIINKLAGGITKNNWVASQLMDYLLGQKKGIASMLPGMGSLLGFAAGNDTVSSTTTKNDTTSSGSGGGGGFLKWLLPLVLLGALAWFLSKGCNGEKTTVATDTKVETPVTKTETHAGHDHDHDHDHAGHDHDHDHDHGHSHGDTKVVDYNKYTIAPNGDLLDGNGKVVYTGSDYVLDAKGNLVDKMGKMIIPVTKLPTTLVGKLKSHLGKYAGVKLEMDDAGNLVDGTGKIVVKKGDYETKDGFYVDKQGNKLGRVWDKIVKAVTDAAEKTVDGMKNLFAGMFAKKPNAKTMYTLSQIEFNKENHRITNFSKAELQGLAAALKADKNSKIDVNVYTADGKDGKENKKLSKIRAEVVRDMLVTLGVDKGQIDFNGKGDSDAAKAKAGRVEISVK